MQAPGLGSTPVESTSTEEQPTWTDAGAKLEYDSWNQYTPTKSSSTTTEREYDASEAASASAGAGAGAGAEEEAEEDSASQSAASMYLPEDGWAVEEVV